LHDLKNQSQLLSGLVKETFRVATPQDIGSALEAALQKAVAGRPGPVAVEIPLEFLDIEAEPETALASAVLGATSTSGARRTQTAYQEPPESAEALQMLEAGKLPVVIVGGGATRAAGQVIDFVDRLQALVVSTAAGKGIVPHRHPLNLGAWLKATEVQKLIARADPLIMLGTEWSPTDLGEHPVSLPANTIRLNTDTDIPPISGVTIRAEVGPTLAAWTLKLAQRKPYTDQMNVANLRATTLREPRRWPTEVPGYLEAMHNILAQDAIIVNDMNTLSYAAVERYPSNAPGTFFFPRGYGTLGYALPAAIGARSACPDQQVVAICGDGGFLFSSEELATAARYGMNLPIVIWNNHSFGAIRATRSAAYGRSVDDDLLNPDFVRLAEAYGCHGVRVTDPAGFSVELSAALVRSGPTLIEIDAPL
jgi:thiamine pyrophosphate-dependent acetolactate synthase large subunit-like protein